MNKILGLSLLLIGMAASCMAAVPEIDPASTGSALTLLAGGLLLFRYRSKK